MTQPSLLDVPYQFDGDTIDVPQDQPRLSRQFDRVLALMQDGQFRTLREIAEAVGGSEAGVSARLRDFRKLKFGGYIVERERISGGLWRYRVQR